jgi:diketogulonate reductase-like aldo/keto reductase
MTRADEIPTTVTLNSGGAMPMVGFGTWQLRGETGYAAVRAALETGYRHLDTATIYGNEAEVGRALRDSGVPRAEVFVTTKVPPERAGREHATLAGSLRALDTEYVDLWLVHWSPPGRALLPMWQELLAAQASGLARAVGVSNYSVREIDQLIEATGRAPAVNQVPWSPASHDAPRLAAHRERGVVLEGYSPLKRTRLRDRTLTAIASAHGVSPAQVVLRWHLQHGIVVIPRSARPERIRSNFDLHGFQLTPDEMSRLDTL